MITHEQAAQLRAQKIGWDASLVRAGLARIESLPTNSITINEAWQHPTPYGERMLAEYDAHYTTIERAELERLKALERKIEAFFGDIVFEIHGFELGNVRCWEEEPGGAWWMEGEHQGYFERSEQAIRRAFELFEVPGEVKS